MVDEQTNDIEDTLEGLRNTLKLIFHGDNVAYFWHRALMAEHEKEAKNAKESKEAMEEKENN
ncbi:hypothetical protein N0V88_007094 [Collariella sp. IMI 366227]|nr:hypothetical protein N0V88_007094 [Collariella sp. IMI 366227]